MGYTDLTIIYESGISDPEFADVGAGIYPHHVLIIFRNL